MLWPLLVGVGSSVLAAYQVAPATGQPLASMPTSMFVIIGVISGILWGAFRLLDDRVEHRSSANPNVTDLPRWARIFMTVLLTALAVLGTGLVLSYLLVEWLGRQDAYAQRVGMFLGPMILANILAHELFTALVQQRRRKTTESESI
jgi:hypothetical protein